MRLPVPVPILAPEGRSPDLASTSDDIDMIVGDISEPGTEVTSLAVACARGFLDFTIILLLEGLPLRNIYKPQVLLHIQHQLELTQSTQVTRTFPS